MNKPSLFLVIAQIALIWLVITPVSRLFQPNSSSAIVGLILLAAGILIFVWAVVSLSLKNLTAMPEPVQNGKLVERGPYEYVRHPMYTALIVSSLGAVIGHGSVLKAIFLLLLVVVLWVKIQREEGFLIVKYPGYACYTARTKKLLPRLFWKGKFNVK